MTNLAIVYNPTKEGVSYGYYHCQECNAAFYGGGTALHEKGCLRAATGYEGLEYVIGRKALATILANGRDILNPITADDIRYQLPKVVEQFETERG